MSNIVYCIIVRDNGWDDDELNGSTKDYYRGERAIRLIKSFINDCCKCSEIESIYKVHPDDVKKLSKSSILTFEDAENCVREILEDIYEADKKLLDKIMTEEYYKKYKKYLDRDTIERWKEDKDNE